MSLPPPRCECSHDYGQHAGPGPCRFVIEGKTKEETERCGCGKFAVPRGPRRAKTPAARPGARGSRKSTPWWR